MEKSEKIQLDPKFTASASMVQFLVESSKRSYIE